MENVSPRSLSDAIAADPSMIADILSGGVVADNIAERIQARGLNISRDEISMRLKGRTGGDTVYLPTRTGDEAAEVKAGASYTWTFTFAQVQAAVQIYVVAEIVVVIVAAVA